MSAAPATACPACGSEAAEVAFAVERPILRCSTCELLFDAAAGDPTAHLYEDEYFLGAGYHDYLGDERQWRREARHRLRWLKGFAPGHRLLEVGCAAGFFLDEARQAGFDCTGVELSPGMAAQARETSGVPVTTAAFEDTELADGSVDVVSAWHVFEHVPEPHPFLARVRRVLRPDGLLAIEVPNIASRTARRAGADWDCFQPNFHRLHFSPVSLSNLLRGAGFDVLTADTLFQAAYQPPATRLRPLPLARRSVRAAQLRHIGLVHPTEGDFVRAVARPAAR